MPATEVIAAPVDEVVANIASVPSAEAEVVQSASEAESLSVPVESPDFDSGVLSVASEALNSSDAIGIAEPPIAYEPTDYPEAIAVTTSPPVSLSEPITTTVQIPAASVVDNIVVPSVVTDELSTKIPISELRDDTIQDENSWHMMLPELKLGGMAQQLAEHCLFKSQSAGKVTLLLERSGETLLTARTEQALTEALQQHFSEPLTPVFEIADAIGETPEKRRIRLRKEQQAEAERAIAADPLIQQLQQKWGGVVIPGSVKPNRDVGVS